MTVLDSPAACGDDAVSQVSAAPSAKLCAYLFIKRAFDIIVSFFGLIILSPLFLAVIIAIRIESEGEAVYTQLRVGKGGKIFKMYKFRSMVNNADSLFAGFDSETKNEFDANFKLKNDPRITKVGDFLRKTSLDELPQLLNILIGDLSVVGPRPICEHEGVKYGGDIDGLLSVKPGLTGYWQVNGRNDTTYEERIKMQMYYVNNRSLILDAKIFFKTFLVVLKQTGAY